MGTLLTRAQLDQRMEAARLYRDEGLSIGMVGRQLKVAKSTVRRWLDALAIETRVDERLRCSRCEILVDAPGLCEDCEWELAHPGRMRVMPGALANSEGGRQ